MGQDWLFEFKLFIKSQLIFVPPYEKKLSFVPQRRRKIWTLQSDIVSHWENSLEPPFCGHEFFLEFINHFIKIHYGISLEKHFLYLEFIIKDFKEKNKDIYHPIIDLIFSHMDYIYNKYGEVIDSPETFFVRVGDNFFVRNLYLAEKGLENYADNLTKKFDNDEYKRIITNVKNTVKRWNEENKKIVDKESKYNKKEKKRYSSPGASSRYLNNRFIIRTFNSTIKVSNVFPIIPNTLDCNLVDQLFVFYSELLKVFLLYTKECKSYTEKEKECTLNYLQGMKDFFYVNKNKKRHGYTLF